ncbi:Coiled-coil domain-containing protein 85C [Bulinus truncatus]|nr:Coiled-coil domain-containing protein 85C [Bulinus truncatus]
MYNLHKFIILTYSVVFNIVKTNKSYINRIMEWETQRPSAPSTPSSMSSQSTSNSVVKNEKIQALKQISPSPSVSTLSKLTDDELRRKGVEDLVRILRRVEGDYKTLLSEHGNIVKDVNRRFQIFVLELRGLKEVNQKLQDDNQELRDLCCFLDDDRQRGRKLAREWQRFGRYTASVMRSEVAVYQEKLRELESRQTELITENLELKELCLFLDQERIRMTGDRDEGDGSSNGTITGQEDGIVAMDTNGSTTPTPGASTLNAFTRSSSVANYIKELELKVQRLEEEKKLLTQRVDRMGPNWMQGGSEGGNVSFSINDQSVHGSVPGHLKSSVTGKPEAVVHAMKVLQVHEELEKIPYQDEDLDDPEKAIVREMCNVVWRKLGDIEDVGTFNESSDSFLNSPYSPEKPVLPSMLSGPVNPQPQMASTPLTGPVKSAQMRNQQSQFTSNQNLSYSNTQRPDRQHPSSTIPSGKKNSYSYEQNLPDSFPKGRLDSETSKNFPEERRNPEQNYSSNSILDSTKNKPLECSDQTSRLPRHPPSSVQNSASLISKNTLHNTVDTALTGHQHSNRNDLITGAALHQKQNVPVQEPPGYSRFAGGDSFDNYDRTTAQQQMGAKEQFRDEIGSTLHTRNRGDNYLIDRNSSERESQMKISSRSYSSSSALNHPVPQNQASNNITSASQLNLRGPTGFRAYPPHLTSMPTQPVAWHGVSRAQEAGRTDYPQEPPAKTILYQSDPMAQTSGHGLQSRGNSVKKFQEQEWRQTYLDDSDTL